MQEIPVDIITRLGLALVAGIIIGLNRWLHHKSAGIRTHSLVALGAAVAMLLISNAGSDAQAYSRVLQGVLTGIGFLGAGVIIRENASRRVHGLTTAASIWACALLGAAFGAGSFTLGLTALGMVMLTLLIGGPLEALLSRFIRHPHAENGDSSTSSAQSEREAN